MEEKGNSSGSLSFLDQCTVMCLGYVSHRGGLDIRTIKASNPDELGLLCVSADQELAEFGEEKDLQAFLDAACHLAKTYESSAKSEDRLTECLESLRKSLDQETFSECADIFIGPPVESWEKVSQLLELIYNISEQHGTATFGTVIDIAVRYMHNTVSDFVTSQGGWRSLALPQSEEPIQSDISSSIVVVQQEGLAEESKEQGTEGAAGDGPEAAEEVGAPLKNANESENPLDNSALRSPQDQTPLPLSPLDTPPFSIPSSVNTDDDRDSLATPPEMVERPLMTESYIQSMGEEELRRASSSTSGNGFEIVGPENGGTAKMQSVSKNIDDARASEPPSEKDMQNVSRNIDDALASEPPSEKGDAEAEVTTVVEGSQIETRESTSKGLEITEEPILGGYLPHISFGIAAAAVAGFFVLKKNM